MFLLLCTHILFIITNIEATDHKIDQLFKTDFPMSNNNGMAGVANVARMANVASVASVAGAASRDGRISTIGGVNYFGPVSSSTQKKTHSWSKDGENMVTSIKIGPGAIAVSSSARIGDNTMRLQTPWPILHPMPWPIYNHFVPSNVFDRQRKIQEWLYKDLFENLESINKIRNTWMYPSFDPFFNY